VISRLARVSIARLAFGAFVCLAALPGRAAAEPRLLPDSTWVDRWRLKNGMEVTVRHVPGCNAVAVITGYHIGRNQDPPNRAGMADLACEVLYTAAAGDVPERTRAEMTDLRPLGWNMQVAPRFTLLSEVASLNQLPGVLRQVAARVAGVTVTDSVLDQARRTIVSEKAKTYAESPDLALYSQIREVALGVSDQELQSRLTGRTLRDVTVAEVDDRLRRLYVPANAVLALAGNLSGLDVHALVGHLFEGIPGGIATPEPPQPPLAAAGRRVRRAALAKPMAGVGIIAPALTDSTHADFCLNAFIVGRFCEQYWGETDPPLTRRFRYPVLADPQIVQLFPPVEPGETDPNHVGMSMQSAMERMTVTMVDKNAYDQQRFENQWIFGGPLMPTFKQLLQQHPGSLHTLASTLAVRALWGSDAFWARYLAQFARSRPASIEHWTDYYQAPENIVRLLFTPAGP
jgi:hypothetical protein